MSNAWGGIRYSDVLAGRGEDDSYYEGRGYVPDLDTALAERRGLGRAPQTEPTAHDGPPTYLWAWTPDGDRDVHLASMGGQHTYRAACGTYLEGLTTVVQPEGRYCPACRDHRPEAFPTTEDTAHDLRGAA